MGRPVKLESRCEKKFLKEKSVFFVDLAKDKKVLQVTEYKALQESLDIVPASESEWLKR